MGLITTGTKVTMGSGRRVHQSADSTLLAGPAESRPHHFLDRALLGLECGSFAALLLMRGPAFARRPG
jgi:hypothetical protein